ncbi:DgyrCDS10958 [Dimorphilus gyrociliatus]|uniref:DgyrCDS10958 n=1 Tax=Dimorphilus gyrociliatus TaxID=2664684 RepID=A0A7I8W2Y9_9ANNE|nr:DgyrCDS10958 [Dimorphilus gyrociliatus]
MSWYIRRFGVNTFGELIKKGWNERPEIVLGTATLLGLGLPAAAYKVWERTKNQDYYAMFKAKYVVVRPDEVDENKPKNYYTY